MEMGGFSEMLITTYWIARSHNHRQHNVTAFNFWSEVKWSEVKWSEVKWSDCPAFRTFVVLLDIIQSECTDTDPLLNHGCSNAWIGVDFGRRGWTTRVYRFVLLHFSFICLKLYIVTLSNISRFSRMFVSQIQESAYFIKRILWISRQICHLNLHSLTKSPL